MSEEKSRFERRDFLKLGSAGIAASALSACATALSEQKPAVATVPEPQPRPAAPTLAPSKPDGPPRRTLGRTGLEVPTVSMGVMNADNPALVRAALDGGMVLLDTAHGYQDGRNEEMLGTVLPARKRDSFILCTKVFVSTLDRKTGKFPPETRPQEIEEKLDLSLKRLGLEHVDILYLHCQSLRESVLHQPLLEALAKAKAAGKTRFIGVSTHKNEPEVLRAAVEAKLYDVVLTAYNFRQDHHLEVQKAIGEAARAGLGIVAMKTQAGVYWDKDKKTPINMKAALKWALRDPNVHTAIPGFVSFDQLEDDLQVLRDSRLSAEEEQSLVEPTKVAGLYCQGCDTCLGQCPGGLPIPELMRSYMYGHAYRNREAAQSLLLALDLPAVPCDDCESCSVVCAKHFDVRARIRDISRLRQVPKEFLI